MSTVRERRRAALRVLSRFQFERGLPECPLRIERRPDRTIALIGTAPDGREYGVGYSAARL
ncbi:hypothetical protein [Pelagerythrobacter aerophilus]|uniref:hypothetical protein n=1 Tax=Pelagerythrobacter aerophilus TaxID=2306995 RepID=UPI0011C3AD33|nr:hypothetical protein [Pelagerythrobacter aerophilus]